LFFSPVFKKKFLGPEPKKKFLESFLGRKNFFGKNLNRTPDENKKNPPPVPNFFPSWGKFKKQKKVPPKPPQKKIKKKKKNRGGLQFGWVFRFPHT